MIEDFTEKMCGCGKMWRGKPGTNPATGCEVCFPPLCDCANEDGDEVTFGHTADCQRANA